MSDKQATRAELLARRLARCAYELESQAVLDPIDASAVCDMLKDASEAATFRATLWQELYMARRASYIERLDRKQAEQEAD